MVQTAAEHRTKASEHFKHEQDSFDRCDTDGFLTQWASNQMGQKENLAALIAENGGLWEYSALFDLEGNLIPAKKFDGSYGVAWGILEDEDPQSRFVSYVNPSKANAEDTRVKNMAKKGYYVGAVMAPAVADLAGSGRGLAAALTVHSYARRTDSGFDAKAPIVDNGQEKLKELGLI